MYSLVFLQANTLILYIVNRYGGVRKKGVPKGYVTIIQDMYNDCKTLVSTRAGDAEYFQLRVGLHQGSALSTLLCILIIRHVILLPISELSLVRWENLSLL